MRLQRRAQRGAYLIVASVLVIALLGFGALSLDLGRLFVLRSQMQNGVDSAALAAAAELSRDAGAQARAEAAARDVLEYESGISDVAQLLGANPTLEFFCAIGSAFDPSDPVVTSAFCTGSQVVENGVTRWLATGDFDSHYVRVTMDPSQASDADAYSIPLFFLPVLNLFGLNVDTRSSTGARALAGRNYNYCDYPPLMMCNPFEGTGQRFQDVMNSGEQILLADQGPGSNWVPGDTGFLSLVGTGADASADFLADEGTLGCTNPIITSEPGQMTQRTRRAINTRFDEYFNPGYAGTSATYPPAPNVIDYANDDPLTFRPPPADKFGSGIWDRAAYWAAFHAWQPWGATLPTGPSGEAYAVMTRYQMYQWELSQAKMPARDPAIDASTCTDTDTGLPLDPWVCQGAVDGPPDAAPTPGRRVFNVAVVNCTAQNLTGRETFTIFGQEGFAKMFLTETAKAPPDRQIWGEYVEWAQPGADSNILVDVQLYE